MGSPHLWKPHDPHVFLFLQISIWGFPHVVLGALVHLGPEASHRTQGMPWRLGICTWTSSTSSSTCFSSSVKGDRDPPATDHDGPSGCGHVQTGQLTTGSAVRFLGRCTARSETLMPCMTREWRRSHHDRCEFRCTSASRIIFKWRNDGETMEKRWAKIPVAASSRPIFDDII